MKRLKNYSKRRIECDNKFRSTDKCRNKWRIRFWKINKPKSFSSQEFYKKTKGDKSSRNKIDTKNKHSKSYKERTRYC